MEFFVLYKKPYFHSPRASKSKIGRRNGGGEREEWVLTVPTNIAVVKNWGKRDEDLVLPINDSIRVTLDPDHLCTTTTVAIEHGFEHDRNWLNGKEVSLSGGRFQNCFKGTFGHLLVMSRMRRKEPRSEKRIVRAESACCFL